MFCILFFCSFVTVLVVERFGDAVGCFNPRIALGIKKISSSSVFESVKNSVQRSALPFRDFDVKESVLKRLK